MFLIILIRKVEIKFRFFLFLTLYFLSVSVSANYSKDFISTKCALSYYQTNINGQCENLAKEVVIHLWQLKCGKVLQIRTKGRNTTLIILKELEINPQRT